MMGSMGRAVSGPRPQPTWMEPGSAFHIKPAAGWSWINDREYAMFSSLINDATSASFSRASDKYGLNSLGYFELFDDNVPAITDLGLCYEPAETGLGVYSLRPEAWGVTGGTQVERIEDIFGSGATWAAQLVANGASSAHYTTTSTATVVSGTSYTIYAIVDAPTSGYVQLAAASGLFGTQTFANFDLSGNGATGTKGTNTTTSGFVKLTTGRFLIWMTAPATASAAGSPILIALVPSNSATRLQTSTSSASIVTHAAQISTASKWGSPIYVDLVPATRAACSLTIKPPADTYDLTYKFGDGTADQVAAGIVIGSGGYEIPTNLNGRFITDIIGVVA